MQILRLFKKRSKLAVFFIKNFIEKLDYLIVVVGHVLEGYKENKVKLSKNLLVQNSFLLKAL